jgi:predicted RecB family nuclease
MRITPLIFDAFLKCATKGHLRSLGEIGSGNEYAEWVRGRDESYQREAVQRLQEGVPETERVVAPPATENLKAAKWRLAVDLVAQTPERGADTDVCEVEVTGNETREPSGLRPKQLLESRLHAVERVPSEGRGKPAQFIPIRFVFRNKLTKDDRLLMAFDALVLSQVLGRVVSLGKIIHGDDHATLKVKTSALTGEARKRLEKIAALLSGSAPPDLVLNRHCPECEFRERCRQKAIEKDDLSLLAGMRADERREFNQKGIFAITQLSYTFRPRRRPKHLRDKREKYHHALKAQAIREKKIYVVGKLAFNIVGTPVYLDVESLPDQDFYYLIGARVETPGSFVQHSFWADDVADAPRIWKDFLTLLAGVPNPCLIYYGSFEKTFLKQMCDRFGGPTPEAPDVVKAIDRPVNLVSAIFSQVYFPVFSNGLKQVAGSLGFKWSEPDASGLLSVAWRARWNVSKHEDLRQKLITYNAEDCEALTLVAQTITRLATQDTKGTSGPSGPSGETEVVNTDDLRHPLINKWRDFSSPLSELEFITMAAHWDYQRDRIYVRTSKRIRRRARRPPTRDQVWRVDKVVTIDNPDRCPRCQAKGAKRGATRNRIVQEMVFSRSALKRRVVRYQYQPYWCPICRKPFGLDKGVLRRGRHRIHGRSLIAYIFYNVIELYIPMQVVAKSLNRLFGLNLLPCTIKWFKAQSAVYYADTQQQILRRIISGSLVHADETHFSVLGKPAYVWVFTNMHEVAYVYSETREGGLAQATLDTFKGVLVSDFYAIYDSLHCPQQKCLIHLIRDLNGAILDNPYDQELKQMIRAFGELLKLIVEDIDRRGLKTYFLGKHLKGVKRFYRDFVRRDYQSPAALACVDRFEKNRDKLFTFLQYDGIPWNNNNAEHAMKAFARLCDVIEGMSNEKGLKEYLVLLSICQTCKYQGLDFLDFLRSGEKDIEVFAESRRGRRRRTQTSQADGLPADASPDTGNQP